MIIFPSSTEGRVAKNMLYRPISLPAARRLCIPNVQDPITHHAFLAIRVIRYQMLTLYRQLRWRLDAFSRRFASFQDTIRQQKVSSALSSHHSSGCVVIKPCSSTPDRCGHPPICPHEASYQIIPGVLTCPLLSLILILVRLG